MRTTLWMGWLFSLTLLTSCNPGDPIEIPPVEDIQEMRVNMNGLNRAVSGWKTKESDNFDFTPPKEH